MRIARVRVENETGGTVWLARLDGDRAELLHEESGHLCADVLREAIAAGIDLAEAGPQTVVPLSSVVLLSPLRNPSKFFGIGLNYATHAAESGMAVPTSPVLFVKTANAILGPGGCIDVDVSVTREPDYEVELAIVIGRRAYRIDDDPMDYVLGYTVCNDVTARDLQASEGQWTRAKSLSTFAPIGPWITTRDELGEARGLRLRTWLNGELMQDGSTDDMIFDVPALVSRVAAGIELLPGDLITTGTPPGVGFARMPPVFLRDGDIVTCAIEGIGELSNHVQVTDWARSSLGAASNA